MHSDRMCHLAARDDRLTQIFQVSNTRLDTILLHAIRHLEYGTQYHRVVITLAHRNKVRRDILDLVPVPIREIVTRDRSDVESYRITKGYEHALPCQIIDLLPDRRIAETVWRPITGTTDQIRISRFWRVPPDERPSSC